MQEVKKLEDLNIPVSQSTSHIAETVVSSIHEAEAPLYIEFSNKNKKDLKETFRNVDFKNPKEGRYAKIFNNYVKKFEEKARDKGIGILMTGNPGTGKTFFANCIWNELKHKNRVYKTSFGKYVREIQKKFEEDKYLERIKRADLIILDDLGNEYFKDDERGSWKKEVLFNLFNTIYENEISLIITTNLNEEELKKFLEIKGSYKVYDRILEKCTAFNFDWESRRAKLYEAEMKELFKIEV